MTEQDHQRFGGEMPAPQPGSGRVPDLGFYAGTPSAGPFGGPGPSGGGAPAGSPSGGADNPFAAPPVSQFGTPAAFPAGATPVPPAPSGPTSSTWKALAGVGAAVLLIVAVFGGRFVWQQFVADPVLPETLGGMPRLSGPEADVLLSGAASLADEELGAGSEVEAAMYGTDAGPVYVLFAVRGSGGGQDDNGSRTDWTTIEVDGLECRSISAQAGVAMGMTACAEGKWRRAVLVMAIGATTPDPTTVATATREAWRAQ